MLVGNAVSDPLKLVRLFVQSAFGQYEQKPTPKMAPYQDYWSSSDLWVEVFICSQPARLMKRHHIIRATLMTSCRKSREHTMR